MSMIVPLSRLPRSDISQLPDRNAASAGPRPNASRASSNVENARKLLGDCVLFRGLAPHERAALVARAHIRRFGPGDTIFLMGALHDSMLAVIDGEVRISVPSADGKEIVLAIVRAGEVFGEIAMLDGKPRSADAKALTSCNVAILHRRDVLAVLARNPTAWLGLVEVLCSRLRHTDQHLVEVALLGLPQRLAKTLLRMFEAAQARTPNRTELRLSQYDLANLVGASRETVNKCLHEWQRAGIIRMEKRVIKIANRAALEDMAEPEQAITAGGGRHERTARLAGAMRAARKARSAVAAWEHKLAGFEGDLTTAAG
jgi:CRP/FNR family cyclic AMP-dependent transcriptional regulator